MSAPQRFDPAVIDAAIGWVVRLQHSQASADDWARFTQWREAAPQHQLAWQRVQSLNQDFACVPAPLAMRTLDGANGVAGRRQALKLLSGAGVAVIALWLSREVPAVQRLRADHATAVGERRRVVLDDGTSLLLNTDSAVDVVFDARARRLILRRGEILIVSGADSASVVHRPLSVEDRHGRYTALGTRFVVRLDADVTRVHVTEGRVRLQPIAGGAEAIADPGASFAVAREGAQRIEDQVMDATAWADGVIAAREMPLAQLLAELSRYRRGWLHCADEVANLRISGVFQTADPDETLDFIGRTQPVRIEHRSAYWVSVRAPRED